MSQTTPYKNPLKRNGTAQLERLIEALSPDSFKLDDRSLKDIMVASYRYASMLQYPDESGAIIGDWTCFWEAETLTFLAVLCTLDTDDLAEGFAEIEKADTDDSGKRGENYLEAIAYLHQLALTIENYYQKLPDDVPLKKEIEAIIRKNRITDAEQLEGALAKLIGWHKDAVNPDFLDQELYRPFMGSPNWGIANEVAFADIDFDDVYATDDWQSLKQLAYQFLQALERIKSRACYWFEQQLGTPQLQQPHIALFLAFLRLFQHTRDEMNGLTKRHLDFYYEKVLHLCRKPAQPDDVYLIFQLANTVDQHLIKEGTELLAGKKDGKPLIFETIENWVFSGATVEQIKNAYVNTGANTSQIYASPDVTAAYENGELLKNVPVDCFRAFGDDEHLPEGAIGFAISSPQLILREGKRIVDIVLEGVAFIEQDESLTIQLSSIEEFIQPEYNSLISLNIPLAGIQEEGDDVQEGYNVSVNEGTTRIRVVLDNDELPVDIPESPLDGGIAAARFPYVKITGSSFLNELDTQIINTYINVRVFGIQERLIVQSDQGIFDGTQKFLPFGSVPEIGDQFFIGSTEVFQKKLEGAKLTFDWIDPPSNFSNHYANYNQNFQAPWLKADFLDKGSLPEKLTMGNTRWVNTNDSLSIVKGRVVDVDQEGINGVTVNVIVHYRIQSQWWGNNTFFFPGVRTFGPLQTVGNGDFSLEIDLTNINNLFDIKSYQIIFNYLNYVFDETPDIIIDGDGEMTINPVLVSSNKFKLVENDRILDSFLLRDQQLDRRPSLNDFDRYNTTYSRGFVRFTLNNYDFLHKHYQNSLIESTIYSASGNSGLRDNLENLTESADPITSDQIRNLLNQSEITLPNAPYTPATNGIRLEYFSRQPMEFDGQYDNFYHILPCGYKKVEPENQSLPLLYNYAKNEQVNEQAYNPEEDQANGNLYLGIQNLNPGSNLSLLFRFKAGTEQVFDSLPPDEADFYWSYLAKNNQWLPFAVDAVLKNTTEGFTRTGIVQLKTPYNMSKENTLFKGDYHWIRLAAVEALDEEPRKTVQALPCLVSIRAQAIVARSVVEVDEPDHYVNPKPLAAETIKRLAKSDSKVKKIEQPFPSFNGRLPEEDNDFYQRVSERLNHRNRAVTVLDYERLLLEQFPTVYRAKCLNHTQLRCEIAPGYVTVAAIPDIKQREVDPDFSPRFSLGDLREMEAFLRTKTNFFVAGNDGEDDYLKVVNPIYEEIRIVAEIKFKAGVDEVFFAQELDNALRFFIAPWAADGSVDISFDRSLSRADFIQFIEQQDYVDAIKRLTICKGKLDPPDETSICTDMMEVESSILKINPSSSYSILTTASQHSITAFENPTS